MTVNSGKRSLTVDDSLGEMAFNVGEESLVCQTSTFQVGGTESSPPQATGYFYPCDPHREGRGVGDGPLVDPRNNTDVS